MKTNLTQDSISRKYVDYGLVLVAIIFSAYFFHNKTYQHSLAYYLSSAVGSPVCCEFIYSEAEVEYFKSLGGESGIINSEKRVYEFKEVGVAWEGDELKDAIGYIGSHGFIAYIKVSKLLFGWFGDLNSVILMGLLLHAASVFLVLSKLTSRGAFYAFVVLYAANPLIIHLASFPYYYYPTVLGSAAVVFALRSRLITLPIQCFLIFCTIFATFMRPTLAPAMIFVFVYFFLRERKPIFLFVLGLAIISLLILKTNTSTEYSPWFSIYVGLGAYDNPWGLWLSDQSALSVVRSASVASIDQGLLYRGQYFESDIELLRTLSLNIASESPFYVLSSAARNFLQLYGFGYRTTSDLLTIISTLFGAFTLLLMCLRKSLLLIGLIAAQNIGYVLYYPPVPAYMASTYLILVFYWSSHLEPPLPLVEEKVSVSNGTSKQENPTSQL